MNDMKKTIAKEIFLSVINKLEENKLQTHYSDECWRLDLLNQMNFAKYKKIPVQFYNN